MLLPFVDDLKLAGEPPLVSTISKRLEKEGGKLKVAIGEFEHCGMLH